MISLLHATHGVGCCECQQDGVYAAIDLPEYGFVCQLCPIHFATFLQEWMACPQEACDRLRSKRVVQAEVESRLKGARP